MAENNNSFLFYKSWWEIIHEEYDDEKTQKELVFAICQYGIEGTKSFPLEKMFLKQAFAQIDSAIDKRRKRVEAGRKGGKNSHGGGAPEGNSNAKKKTTSKQQANENENSNENVNENENENDNNKNILNNILNNMPSALPLEEAASAQQDDDMSDISPEEWLGG